MEIIQEASSDDISIEIDSDDEKIDQAEKNKRKSSKKIVQ
jgi:hypothetical protein